jgi:predicted Fe-S protein YdhL (DUF1289 family)
MTQDEIKALIEDLRLNHEFCPKEVILQAADELEKQRTWVGLTDEERSKIWGELPQTSNEERDACIFAQAIEAKLKEKNT